MANLTTKFLGLQLKNPVIVGASNLIKDVDNCKKMEEAGAAAIVYKTLFEEQIELERLQLSEELNQYNERHAEMISLFPDIEHAGPREHLSHLKKVVDAVKIPVIASLNCTFDETWVEYAKQLENTGINALELNFYAIPGDFKKDGKAIINEQIDVVSEVKKNVKIPVSVKLSSFYTNALMVVQNMYYAGADGFVLFNRLFQPDIDLEKEEHHFPYNLSHEEDNRLAQRFIGLLYGEIHGSLCANTGIFNGKDVVKMILTGADCVQVVSTIYKHGIGQINKIIEELETWMEHKQYDTLDAFRGKLARKHQKDTFAYRRGQYIDILMNSEEIFKKYPMR
ncbi:MAG: dihydroorotate dehydrogenase-like protein [Bacteroidales bacterium]|jgi:dihydroorotate dehydrogenase (fumarate)|nr:dihydroorotate dehydrogenase-like protein [Bacteroidales bacterium]